MNWKDDSLFPGRLRQLRERFALTQSEFATRVDVSRGAISMYEAGDRVPDIRFLEKVIEEFECSYDYLMGRSEAVSVQNVDVSKATGLSDEALYYITNNAEVINEMARLLPNYLDGLLLLSGIFLSGKAFNPNFRPASTDANAWLSTVGKLDLILADITNEWRGAVQLAGYEKMTTDERARMIEAYQTATPSDSPTSLRDIFEWNSKEYDQAKKRAIRIIQQLTNNNRAD